MKLLSLAFFCALFFAISFSAHSQSKIVLADSMIYSISWAGNPEALIDEQTLAGDPKNNVSGTPTTVFDLPGGSVSENSRYIFDLAVNYADLEVWFYDVNAIDTIFLFTGSPAGWNLADTFRTGQYLAWHESILSDTSRFLMIEFNAPGAKVNEMVVYGTAIDTPGVVLPTPVVHALPDVNDLMAINGFVWNPDSLFECVGAVREYRNWYWMDGGTLSDYDGFPNNEYAFEPAYKHSPDAFYQEMKSRDIDVNPCLQGSTYYLIDSVDGDLNHKPISDGEDAMLPESYREHADFMYQFTARYGRGNVPASKLKLRDDQTPVSGLDLINTVENWNEQDKWWRDREGYFTPFEMAAMSSADYDGHEGAMGDSVGVKNADSTMKMAMGGLAILDVEYIRGMKLWSDYNRTTGFPADALNFHHYSNDAGGQGGTPTVGISPEDDNLKERLIEIAEFRDKYLPGLEIWLSEFGYSSDPNSIQRAPAIGNNNGYEIQGRWLLRSFLEVSAAGIDRAHLYILDDQPSENPSMFATCGLVKDEWDWSHAYYVNGDTFYHEHDSYERKKSWFYVSCMKNALDGFVFQQELVSGNPNVNVYEYRTTNGDSIVYAVWCPTSNNTVIDDYVLTIGSDAYSANKITPMPDSIYGSDTTLAIDGDSVTFRVSEMPVFIRKIKLDPVAPVAIANNFTVYLDQNGEASIEVGDIDSASYDNYGIITRTLSQSDFDCADVSSGGAGGTVSIASNDSWKKSTYSVGGYSFPWAGAASLPAEATFSVTAIEGQPHSWHSIDSFDQAKVIKTTNEVTFFRQTFTLASANVTSARFRATGDDDFEIYVNGTWIAREGSFVSSNAQSPAHDLLIPATGSATNGNAGGDSFDAITTDLAGTFFTSGTNEVIIAVRNGGGGNIGGFAFQMDVTTTGSASVPVVLTVTDNNNNVGKDTAYVTVLDTMAPMAIAQDLTVYLDVNGEVTITADQVDNGSSDNCNAIVTKLLSDSTFSCAEKAVTSLVTIVSDSSWKKSTYVQTRSFPWEGIDSLPHDTSFTGSALLGTPIFWKPIDALPGAEVIQTTSDVTFFRKTFTMNGDLDFEALVEITCQDNAEIFVNGHSIGRTAEGEADEARKAPPHRVYFPADSAASNGHDGGEAFTDLTTLAAADFLHDGLNTVIIAIENRDAGGLSFRMVAGAGNGNLVTLTVVDSKGDSATAEALVKVVDNIAPTALAQNISISLDSITGTASITAAQVDNGSSDNCAIESLEVAPSSFDCSNPGSNAVVLTATDANGNSATASATVTVDTAGACAGFSKSGSTQVQEGMQSFSVFPNPANDIATLRIVSAENARLTLQLMELSGRQIWNKQEQAAEGSSDHEVDLTGLPAGVYMLKVFGETEVANLRLVKE